MKRIVIAAAMSLCVVSLAAVSSADTLITGGAGAQVLTGGRDVRVPAETVLRFRLDRAVMLQPER